jgi:hypothetical protein
MRRVAIYVRQIGTEPEPIQFLGRTVERHGDTVVATYADDDRLTGRGKYAEWQNLLARLETVDQIALPNAGDIPGKTVNDLLKILGILRDHGVGLYLRTEGTDTASTNFALLDLIGAYRRAKLSQAIRNGQAKAVAAGKRIGRPTVPHGIVSRIQAAFAPASRGTIRPAGQCGWTDLVSACRRTDATALGQSDQHSLGDSSHAMHVLIIADYICVLWFHPANEVGDALVAPCGDSSGGCWRVFRLIDARDAPARTRGQRCPPPARRPQKPR